MLRLTGGAARGCRLALPPARCVRPATDRLRESLFAILDPLLKDVRVLDLFAGSGVLGLEALSRGAAHCTFVEKDEAALRVLVKNVTSVGFPGRCTILQEDLQERIVRGGRFGLVFVDPPFALFADARGLSLLTELLRHVRDRLIERGGTVVLRHEKTAAQQARDLIEAVELEITRDRSYGRSCIQILRRP